MNKIYLCLCAGILFFFTSCREKRDKESKIPVAQVTKAAQAPNTENIGITLPVLDALFFEEGFETALQSELKLTKQQLQQLKSVSGSYVAALTEEGNSFGSARQASQSALEEIKKIIGDEKTKGLLQLIARRYAQGNIAGLLPTRPNAIPADTRIVVNAPAFRMDVYQQGKLVQTYRIGVGYPEFPLPTGMRAAEKIIFNPTWTPPDEAWVKGKFQPGRKVAAGSKLNPLGLIKIPIGLPSLIHGGKAIEKLGDFASHGCVGLTNGQIQNFTMLLARISGTPLPADSIKLFENAKTKTKTVQLNQSIPVELRYETIVAQDGNLIIYRDIYERGTNTPAEAKRILETHGVDFSKLSSQEKMALNTSIREMNMDSRGKPIATFDINADADSNSAIKDRNREQKANKGTVTRTVKGKKEAYVPIAALKEKGYPAPVNPNNG
ncbi:L,D-transpeptidase [Niabella pedocola]|uniref:L,D-transpeptidase n=1 Tax=Niabella pedocola TaxID=1752077 RepID=A0ABS8PKA2_9BACT|nr:L,D-transpeptidase [Niabella pedocola]MCD2421426.1 L,D-transpeptidase [Niabella pedocola]